MRILVTGGAGYVGSHAVKHFLARGHDVSVAPPFDSGFGHANVITVEDGGGFAAAADPRARVGSAAGS